MGNNIRKLRRMRHLTQVGLQMQTGIEQGLISKFETGGRIPPTETLIRLANFFETSMDYIMCRTDEVAPYPPLRETD